MPFQGFTLTKFGHKMLGKALIGKPLHLTRAALGDGVLTEEIPGMTALCGERMSTLLSGVLAGDHSSTVVFRVTSDTLDKGFYCREIGVFARDPDTLEEGLYLYDNSRDAGTYLGDKDDYSNRVDALFRVRIKLSQTEQITFDPGGEALYVLYQEYADRVKQMQNELDGAVLMLADHEARIRALEDAFFNDISKNPWSVRFENLTGLLVTGVWSVDKRHITC